MNIGKGTVLKIASVKALAGKIAVFKVHARNRKSDDNVVLRDIVGYKAVNFFRIFAMLVAILLKKSFFLRRIDFVFRSEKNDRFIAVFVCA